MKQIYKAKIIWLSKDCGGRSGGIPFGDKYVPILVPKGFDLDLNNSWSAFVENVSINKKNESIAKIYYLSDKAPNNLCVGVEFDLYEGTKKVAKGIIIDKA